MMFEVIALNLKTSTSDIKLSTSNLKRSCHDATAPFLHPYYSIKESHTLKGSGEQCMMENSLSTFSDIVYIERQDGDRC